MMRTPLIAVLLCSVSAAVYAQSANDTVTGLQSCFQSARRADVICANPANDPAQRLDCLEKARTAQLECLKQVLPETSAGPAAAEKSAASEKTAAIGGSELPVGVVSEKPSAAVAPNVPAKAVDTPAKPQDTNWVVSETTSPVDYAPLITAAIRLPFSVKHAPNILAIRCRGRRTELLVRTEGTWRASRAGEIQVEYQINDLPVVKLSWTASADRKTAIYQDDPVGLLQSLPEGGRLKVNVLDAPDPSHEATFQLAGLNAVRDKIGAACKWAPVANKVTSEKR